MHKSGSKVRLLPEHDFCGLLGVAGAAHLVEARQAVVHCGQCREGGVRFGLVPVGHGEVVVGAAVGVAVLDSGFDGFGEGDRRVEMETVNAAATPGFFFANDGRAVK